MKETPIFEEVFTRLIAQPGFALKLLVGGLFSFVPILNIFAFGYLYRFSMNARHLGRLELPVWDDWKGLFLDGLRFAVVWLAYWLVPMLLVFSIWWLFGGLSVKSIFYLPFSLVFLISPLLFSAALYRMQMRSDFKDLLDVLLIVRMAYSERLRFIVPAFVFLGAVVLALPLYGFAFFFGFLTLIAYTGLCYRKLEGGSQVII